tara:strand:+ start:14677 stop:15399 length:723 start_codon:yes stop_codon:yes gene_type:complete
MQITNKAQAYTLQTTTAQTNASTIKKSFGDILQQAQKNTAQPITHAPTTNAIHRAPSHVTSIETLKGVEQRDLTAHYAGEKPPMAGNQSARLEDHPPIMIPSANNIKTLSEHASKRFKQIMQDYNIPSAPNQITFNDKGEMYIPNDYPYKAELTHALEENPGLVRELRDINALTSHYVGMQESQAFRDEMEDAVTQAQIDAIIQKYSYLFNDNRKHASIAVGFTPSGSINLMANGQSVTL